MQELNFVSSNKGKSYLPLNKKNGFITGGYHKKKNGGRGIVPLPDTAGPAILVEPFYNPFNKIDMSMDSGNGWAIVSPLWSPVKYNT